MRTLSELDASFLFLESSRAPLHVGGTYTFRKKSSRSRFSFDRFKAIIESKLGNEQFFRQKLVEAPLNHELPIWCDDAQFDLDKHVHHIKLNTLAAPCSLEELSAKILNTPLDRDKPLWQAYYVDGLENEKDLDKTCFALILVTHIAALDASSGEDILSQLLDVSPKKTKLGPPKEWIPTELPSSGSLLEAAYNKALTIPTAITGLLKDTASAAFYGVLYEQLQRLNLPATLLSVAATPLNKKVTSKRESSNIKVSFATIRDLKQHIDNVTTNDILIGICAEALSQYLKAHGTLPKAPLIALSPISVRSTSLHYRSGKQLTASLFSLITNEPNPIRRIHAIHEMAKSSNHYDDAISANRLTELVPTNMAALSARVYSEFLLAQKFKPMFNLPIINIPGPQFPLYFEDNELISLACNSPLYDGIGLTITIISYNGYYNINTTYCTDLVTDKCEAPFSLYLEQALKEIQIHQNEPVDDTIKIEGSSMISGIVDDITGLVSGLFESADKP
jgi:diacylglycerol O-acyltransferase / wax synthase